MGRIKTVIELKNKKKVNIIAYLSVVAVIVLLAVLIDKQNKTEKNIFWDSPCEEAKMQWISNDMLSINDKSLHIPDETYDFRG